MNEDGPYPNSADPASPEPSAARVERCTCRGGGREPDPTDDNLRATHELRDLALAVARKLAARIVDDDTQHPAALAAAPEEASDAPGDRPKPQSELSAATLAFQRAERAVRQCILLSTKLHTDRLAWETQAEAMAAKVERERRQRHKSQIERLVKEAIERDAEESGEDSYERLEKLNARIDEDDIESDLGYLADSALVDRLCKDCDVEAPWDRWDGEHWAQEEARTKPPGSVFTGARRSEAPEAGMDAGEPVEAEASQAGPPRAEPVQPEAAAPAATAPEPPEAKPPSPEPGAPYDAAMEARMIMALRTGGWLVALQRDPRLASYIQARLLNRS